MASSDAPLIEEALPDELHLQRLSKLYAHGALGLFLSIACSIFWPGKALEHWYVRLLVFATSFITTTVCSKQLRLDTPTGKHVGLAIASVGLGISCSKYMTAQGIPQLMDATIKSLTICSSLATASTICPIQWRRFGICVCAMMCIFVLVVPAGPLFAVEKMIIPWGWHWKVKLWQRKCCLPVSILFSALVPQWLLIEEDKGLTIYAHTPFVSMFIVCMSIVMWHEGSFYIIR